MSAKLPELSEGLVRESTGCSKSATEKALKDGLKRRFPKTVTQVRKASHSISGLCTDKARHQTRRELIKDASLYMCLFHGVRVERATRTAKIEYQSRRDPSFSSRRGMKRITGLQAVDYLPLSTEHFVG